ncbi:HofP DNA utilization family protein [Kosakonia oryzendophytica]|uniref:HofP DNA utilization family protein n=1 Tax=Kosakonia TaxID=1330547 RepID=UPI0009005DB2|nr:HofP DNA utilization family protein [Kosakonia oryzendophytica]WBT58601.1 HofP DNA utilization family protein [Kosakonia oryzendophytica]
MTAKRLLCAGGLCLLLSGMRDPFQPPRDTCLAGQLASWRVHGVVAGEESIGILRDDGGRWRRVVEGDRLPTGWRVIAVDEHGIRIALGEHCVPAEWRWKREGDQDEKMDSQRRVLQFADRLRTNTESGDADGG